MTEGDENILEVFPNREHCQRENEIRSESKKLTTIAMEKDEEEHRLLMEYNDQENERVAQLRRERQEKEKEELIKSILEHKAQEEQKEMKELEESYKILRETQELVKLFIEREDLEKAINHAIDNPVDYNFAIDLDGRKYEGRFTQPHKVERDSLPVFQVRDQGFTNEF
ncbi:putative 28S ribosomal protein S26, mitochondrial [Armadillidium nasatum]|uniref:Small ribosomal subunit protein mS26 n=1 Tax=Armadillidium nasatum TaxID=96803 RepID=A0A5N5TGL8_9CRUS|nr:putative 28S ribosomal protein S26, mitochondrial [Armadillidium nasatum]